MGVGSKVPENVKLASRLRISSPSEPLCSAPALFITRVLPLSANISTSRGTLTSLFGLLSVFIVRSPCLNFASTPCPLAPGLAMEHLHLVRRETRSKTAKPAGKRLSGEVVERAEGV